ncbi:MAG: hypothetical protein ACD_75C01098G0002 [uncultured bacterium]|nr:MAG: hypothetical protein ACD_75C01098G0002 [uncultured bacterium]
MLVDELHDLFANLSDQHHLRDLHRLGVGYPHPIHELRLFSETLHQIGDLCAAAMHDDRVDADKPQQNNVGHHRLFQGRIHHCRAAVFNHDRLTVELPDIRQRLNEDFSAPG